MLYKQMKKLIYSFLLALFVANVHAQSLTDTLRHEVLLETDSGNIRIQLYNETPRHRDNFLKWCEVVPIMGVVPPCC